MTDAFALAVLIWFTAAIAVIEHQPILALLLILLATGIIE